MIKSSILEKLEVLPESLQVKFLKYIEALISDSSLENGEQSLKTKTSPKKYRVAGTMEGMIIMSDDFDEPLEDLKDYM
jgi:Protein of unknown function (DUF2281)